MLIQGGGAYDASNAVAATRLGRHCHNWPTTDVVGYHIPRLRCSNPLLSITTTCVVD
jgi:hypothetical protein